MIRVKNCLPLILFACCLVGCGDRNEADYTEQDVATLQDAMHRGELSAYDLVNHYLQRIDALDRNGPRLNSIIELNPDALRIASELDRERQVSGPRGPLHGIPLVLKANIDTADRMATTAGSLALADHSPPDDAFLVARLIEAGAIILGKANLSEWANFRSSNSSSGWSSIGGQTRNPYDTARSPCGSSSGSAVAVSANLAVLAVGTETDGSIICPAGINGIVGIKPTLGLVSRDGIIPIAHSQDTAGPMARSVRDAAILLNVLAAADPRDPASGDRPTTTPDYTAHLSADALRDKRIGVLRSHSGAGKDARIERLINESIDLLKGGGAEIIDPIEIDTQGAGDAEYEVLLFEFKADLNDYLEGSGAKLRSLADIIEFNNANADRVMPIFGQEIFHESQSKGTLDDPAYLAALAESKSIMRNGIDATMDEHDLDALIAPSNGPAWMIDHVNGDNFSIGSSSFAAISGYASVSVPAGFISGLPVGMSFIGGAFSEKQLIEIAYAFEQASQARRPPSLEGTESRAGNLRPDR
ncbi:MAG: amidase [Gammaproteobacteria bacterium]|nr:amidase [Gammaproteobacteria bacterium]MDH4314206.1 amidase [Gammaproteobacteria bacterium]MDH5213237.1 amidase [Gammaproteobacteria bacterium]